MKLDFEQLRELIRLLDESNLTEIEVERGNDRIRVRRDPAPIVGAMASPSVGGSGTTQSDGTPAVEDDSNYVTSPFVGTFYRAPSPEIEAFVQEGDSIAPGQVLCIVEAMKLMNEIESEVSGTIVEVLVESGKPVEYGDRLFRIETD